MRLSVLAFPAYKNRKENPYNFALYSAITACEVDVVEASVAATLRRSYAIHHIHWPDAITWTSSSAKASVLFILFFLKVLLAKFRGAKIVWTVHNLKAHKTAHPFLEHWLWRFFIPQVDATIHLSSDSVALAIARFRALGSKKSFVIRHGHYRGWYPNTIPSDQARSSLSLDPQIPLLAFVGQIKTYKNIPCLIKCFRAAFSLTEAQLVIAGKTENGSLESELRTSEEDSSNIHFHSGLIADSAIQLYLNACTLAVFPYLDILNSGSAILALSFNRPVLVPGKGAMADLQALIGDQWVMTYPDELTGETLRNALAWAVNGKRPAECDLTALAWDAIGRQTVDAYRDIADLK